MCLVKQTVMKTSSTALAQRTFPFNVVMAFTLLTATCQAQLEIAPPLFVDVDATGLSAGPLTSITNSGTLGGFFQARGGGTTVPVAATVDGGGTMGIRFDGGDYLQHVVSIGGALIPAPGGLVGVNPTCTIEVWVLNGAIDREETILAWGRRGGAPDASNMPFNYGWDAAWGAVGHWGPTDIGWTSGLDGGGVFGPGVPSAGVWHHLVYTFDGSTQRVYADGVQKNSEVVSLNTAAGPPIILAAQTDSNGTSVAPGVRGSLTIGKVRIHDGVLSASQIATNYLLEVSAFTNGPGAQLLSGPAHRYQFNNAAGAATAGSIIQDSVGTANGTVLGTGANFTGSRLTLPGGASGTAAYVDLPDGLLSVNSTNKGGAGEVTIEGWIKVMGNRSWSRIFDFGSSSGGSGQDYLFYGAQINTDVYAHRVEVKNADGVGGTGGGGTIDHGSTTYGTNFHFAITWNDATGEMRVYENGEFAIRRTETARLSQLNDVNVWLGRSQYTSDQNMQGEFDELRIYNRVLSDEELRGNFLLGPSNILAQLTTFTVTGGGTACGSVPVGLSGSELEVTYYLRRNSLDTGLVVAGTGAAISFGNQTVSGLYTVMASNTATAITATMNGGATATVNVLPIITSGPTPLALTNHEGAIISFSINAVGTSLSYQWRRDGTNLVNGGRISGANSATLTISPADTSDSVGSGHGYTCVVSGVCNPPAVSTEATAVVIPFVAVPETVTGAWTNRYDGPGNAMDVVTAMTVDGNGNVIATGYSNNKVHGNDMVTVKYSPAGLLLWSVRYNGSANRDDKAVAVAVDSNGNVIVTGSSQNASNEDYYTAKYAAANGALLWERRFNGPGNLVDLPKAVAVDGGGHVIVTGSSQAGATLEDYYTAKYAEADGALLWEKRYDGPRSYGDIATAVAVDTNGNVAVTGYSRNLANNDDYYTAKYAAADGVLLWEQRYNGPANGTDQAYAITVDRSGNVAVTGQSPNAGKDDIYTAKYAAADGTLVWERRYNSSFGSDRGNAIAVDGSDNLVVAGYSAAAGDAYAAKYAAADGSVLWERTYDGPLGLVQSFSDVAVDASGNVVVTGKSGNGAATGTGVYWDNIYSAKYASADGALLWEETYDGPANGADVGVSIALDDAGNVVIAGNSYNGISSDYYVAKYGGANGALQWEQRLNQPANEEDFANAVAIDASGNVAVTGYSVNPSNNRDLYTAVYAPNGALLWDKRFNSGPNANEEGVGVAFDSNGNVIVIGTVPNGWNDFYTAKYAAADGALLWEKQYDGPAHRNDAPTALVVDGSGNVIVTGLSENNLWEDFFTAKYAAADGSLLWEARYNSPANYRDIPRALGVDTNGNVFVTGESDSDYYTAKYAATDGALLWERRYEGTSGSGGRAWDLVVDAQGDVIVAGDGEGFTTIKYAGGDGTVRWTKTPAINGAAANSVAVDASGNVFVTGLITDNFSTYDFYTVKYSATDGTLLWLKRGPGVGNYYNRAPTIATDGNGDPVVTGFSSNGSNYDFYTLKFAGENGVQLWSARYNGPANGNDWPATLCPLAIGPAGEVVVTGSSDGDFGAGVALDYVTIKYASVAPTNTRPVIANAILDTNGVYGLPFNFTFSANTFSDPDAGQTLSYSSTGVPAGITFTPATRTFSGTPTSVGTNSVTVTATDNGSPALSTNDVFDIVIAKAPLTVTAFDTNRVYGAANPALTGSLVGLVNGDNITAAFNTTATIASLPGIYPITPVWSDANSKLGNYLVTTNTGTLTITSPPELSFTLGGGGGGLFTLSWPASYAGFVLEYTEILTPPVEWHAITTGITESGGIKSYTVMTDVSIPSRLYRLRLP